MARFSRLLLKRPARRFGVAEDRFDVTNATQFDEFLRICWQSGVADTLADWRN